MLIGFFLMMVISSSLTVPRQLSPRCHVEASLPFKERNLELNYGLMRLSKISPGVTSILTRAGIVVVLFCG